MKFEKTFFHSLEQSGIFFGVQKKKVKPLYKKNLRDLMAPYSA